MLIDNLLILSHSNFVYFSST